MRLGRGLPGQRAHSRRYRGDAAGAVRGRSTLPGPLLLAAGGAGESCSKSAPARVKFDDEPVPGYPLPILPGHTSPGRFERVLRAGGFAVTTELAPPDSADPEDVYKRARVFDGYVDAINATDGSGANCHMSSLAVCALLTRVGYAPDHADLLPRQESHRDPGRHPRRRRDGRVQHAVPDRRRRAGGRSSAGKAGVRSGLRVAARDRAHAARRAPLSKRPQDQLCAARVPRRRRESLRPAARLAAAAPGQEGRRGRAVHPDPILLRPAAAARLHGPGRGARPARQDLHPGRRRSAALGEDGRVDAQERPRHACSRRHHRAAQRRAGPGARGPQHLHRADPVDARNPRRQRRARHGLPPGRIGGRDRRAIRRSSRPRALVSRARRRQAFKQDTAS